MITNLVVALMIVSTNYVPVHEIVAVSSEPRDEDYRYSYGLMIDDRPPQSFHFEMQAKDNLYRKEVATNFVYCSDIDCRPVGENTPNLIEIARSTAWIKFCACECHKKGCAK